VLTYLALFGISGRENKWYYANILYDDTLDVQKRKKWREKKIVKNSSKNSSLVCPSRTSIRINEDKILKNQFIIPNTTAIKADAEFGSK
jgi:hypothetical protein